MTVKVKKMWLMHINPAFSPGLSKLTDRGKVDC